MATSGNTIEANHPNGDTRITLKVQWADADKSTPAVEFVNFECVPKEIQVAVWKFAVVPRLIIQGPGGAPLPGYAQPCRTARDENRKEYSFIIRPLLAARDRKYAMLINWDLDLLWSKSKIPYFRYPHITPDRARQRRYLQSDRKSRPPWRQPSKNIDFLKPCKRYAVTLPQMAEGDIWERLGQMLPKLEHLVVFVRPYPSRDTLWEDLMEVDVNDYRPYHDNADSEEPKHTEQYIPMNRVVFGLHMVASEDNLPWLALAKTKLTFMCRRE